MFLMQQTLWYWIAVASVCGTATSQSTQIKTDSLSGGFSFLPSCVRPIGLSNDSQASVNEPCTDGDPTRPFYKGVNAVLGQDAGFGYYIFKNIRYASPPVNRYRWQSPQYPEVETYIDTEGWKKRVKCPQAQGGMPSFFSELDGAVTAGLGLGSLHRFRSQPRYTESEDCLYMDVYVEQELVRALARRPDSNSTNGNSHPTKRSSVVFLHGGPVPFGSGSKEDFDLGATLGRHPGANFFVPNYRLGAFGFLAAADATDVQMPLHGPLGGPYNAQNSKIVSNTGLIDQRMGISIAGQLAKELGTDEDSLTIWGKGHGATMALYHAANPDNIPFSQVIAESPVFFTSGQTGPAIQKSYDAFLKIAGCEGKSPACLREASSEALLKANAEFYSNIQNPLVPPFTPITGGDYGSGRPETSYSLLDHPMIKFSENVMNDEALRGKGVAFVDKVIITSHLEQNKFLQNLTGVLFNNAGPAESFIASLDSSSASWKKHSVALTDMLMKKLAAGKAPGSTVRTPELAAEYIALSQRCMLSAVSKAYRNGTFVASFENSSPELLTRASHNPSIQIPWPNLETMCSSSRTVQQIQSTWQSYLLGLVVSKNANTYTASSGLAADDPDSKNCRLAERAEWSPANTDATGFLKPVLTNNMAVSSDFKLKGRKIDDELCAAWVDLFRA